jgi:PII-like signaling protein
MAAMNPEALKLTVYAGECDRVDHGLLTDALLDLYARNGIRRSLLLLGVEGFGRKHRLRTDRLTPLSDDLPVLAEAVDVPERIDRLLPSVVALCGDGLLTLERAQLVGGQMAVAAPREDRAGATRLTIYCSLHDQALGRPAFRALVDLLRSHGIAGATVFRGVDGTLGSHHPRSVIPFNADAPIMIVSVGDSAAIADVVPRLAELLPEPLITVEPHVEICKRDGELLRPPATAAATDAQGLARWQKLTVFTGEQTRYGREQLYQELVRRLRSTEVSGATVVRGVWGYHGDQAPHGERLRVLGRRLPIMAVIVDTPDRIREAFEIVDELTTESGLVTSEFVPAFRASAHDVRTGGLRLARPVY